MTSSKLSDLVREFHDQVDYPNDKLLAVSATHPMGRRSLVSLGDNLERLSKHTLTIALQHQSADQPCELLYRAHLMLEELGELLQSMGRCDTIEAADALVDLLYVVIGTGVTYRLPVEELFEEVHRSNMTKFKVACDPRLKECKKSSSYSPPDLTPILRSAGLI